MTTKEQQKHFFNREKMILEAMKEATGKLNKKVLLNVYFNNRLDLVTTQN